MDEEEKNENKKDEALLGGIGKKVKKNNKSVFKMIASWLKKKTVINILLILAVILIVYFLLGGLIQILDFEGDNNIASEAINSALKNKELVNIAKAPGDQGYYFKIDQKIKDEYVKLLNKAYYEGYYHENQPKEDEDKPEFEYNQDRANIKEEDIVEWFLTEDYEPYLIKMMKAEIASSYPKLGDYEGEDDPKSEKNRELGNKIDPDGNYVAQGRTKIQRTKMGLDGTPEAEAIDLEYVPYEEFQEMLKRTDESAMEVLNYFSFKEDLIYYATYRIVTVEVNGVEVSRTFALEEAPPISSKTVTNMCNMPYNFLFAILQSSENPEWTMAVIDLLLKDENHELILMIQDQLNIVKDTVVETEYHAQRTVTETFTSVGSERTGYGWVSNGLSNATYTYPAGAPIITTTVTTTYANTAQVFVKKAKTWCIDFEQEANLVVTEEEGEEVVTDETAGYTDATYAGLGYPSTSGASGLGTPTSAGETTTATITSLSNGTLLYSTSEKIDTKDFSWEISTVTEKRINYERFLGLWKNTKGEYEIGCLFDPNGKKVGYTLPKQDDTLVYPPDTMSMENHQDIDYLIEALLLHEDTQMHEQLMMYYWNMYTGENWYDVDLDAILDMIQTDVITINGSGSPSSLLKEYIRSWEGRPKYNSAGTMYVIFDDGFGHPTVGYGIDIENSGFKNQFIQMGYPTEIGGEVPIDFVDGLEDQEINDCLNYMKAATSGLNLEEYQLHALVSRAYNCGASKAVNTKRGSPARNFVDSYKAYWNNATDNLYKANSANMSHSLYTQYMSKPDTAQDGDGSSVPGLVRRRASEWRLFQTGYYDTLGKWYEKGATRITQKAKEIHDYMASYGYKYCLNGKEKQKHSGACGLDNTFEQSKTGHRLTCCATYVSWVLQECDLLNVHTNSTAELNNLLVSRGWIKINNKNDLKPGDIIIYTGHTEIYAGDGLVYNAGSNDAISGSVPQKRSIPRRWKSYIFTWIKITRIIIKGGNELAKY